MSEDLTDLTDLLVDRTVGDLAAEAGRTPAEQWERMGDHFAFIATEADPNQAQLVDYAIEGDTVEVRR